MECKKNGDTYEKVSGEDGKRKMSSSSQPLMSEGQYKDVCYSDLQGSGIDTGRAQCSVDINDSDSGEGRFCTWKVTAIVFIALSALLLITIATTGGIWLKESDNLEGPQKTSTERSKQLQEDEEQKYAEREREIRAEEEKKMTEREEEIRVAGEKRREEREQEIREEERKKGIERELEIRAEEEQKRMQREGEIREEVDRKMMEREREIRGEEERKWEEREREIRAEEERIRQHLVQEIRQEEEEKRHALERFLAERERRMEELRSQCNGGQMISAGFTGLGALLPLLLLLLVNGLSMVY